MNKIIVINKNEGCTSQAIVSKVKKILNEKKVGHTGTLDPMAKGALPILLGNATKISKYLVEHDKIYIAKVMLGKLSSTGDREGKIIEEKSVEKEILSKENVEKIFKSFIGKIKQTPPIYSAIKVDGKKLYEYAREGKSVEIPEREIEIYSIELLEILEETNEIIFKVHCSKGTYIRTLCEDIAKALGNIGYMTELNRIAVGRWSIENSVTIEDLEKNQKNPSWIDKNTYNIEETLNLEKIDINPKKEKLFLNGVMLDTQKEDGVYHIYCNQKYLGTGIVKNKLLKRDVIL